MIYELLKRNILNSNPYKDILMLALMLENFKVMKKITQPEYDELYLLLYPQEKIEEEIYN